MSYDSEIVNEIPKGLICWYEFKAHAKLLYIADSDDVLTEWLKKQDVVVTRIALNDFLKNKTVTQIKYDYILAINVIENFSNPVEFLIQCKSALDEKGIFLLGTDNRMGVRYFCGDRDPFTNRSFDGIENYRRANLKKEEGRCYSRAEIKGFLSESGFLDNRFYSVFPEIEHPQHLVAEDYLPNEELAMRCIPLYRYPDVVFLEEEFLYSDLISNGMFHAMANAYFIECGCLSHFANVNHVTLSLDRGKKDALITTIRRDKIVEKSAVYEEGMARFQQLQANETDLLQHGIRVIPSEYDGRRYKMPFIDGELASIYLRRLLKQSTEKFIQEMDYFRDIILSSSEIARIDEENGPILKKGYFDLVSLNCFHVDGEYVFFDQEFCIENYPANIMITRSLTMIYQDDTEMEAILPKRFFFERYGIKGDIGKWNQMQMEFLSKLRNEFALRVFHEKHRRSYETVHTNRQRINFSDSEYERLFKNIFEQLDSKKLILFGSGRFADQFMALYGKDYVPFAIVDNNQNRWGKSLNEVKIFGPELFEVIEKEECKVIICIKNYLPVMKQLTEIGMKHIGIFDPNQEYKRKVVQRVVKVDKENDIPKKYHVGYIAGVFDLYHIGHLNMFKRAKEQCDHLIVGVVTDEGVRKNKKVEPFIPFEERIEMVRSCKYVDEAVEIPLNYGGTRDAYRLYHFDAQFSGSDYIDNPNWLAEKEFLEKHGAELVFFPYTEQTSSTKIKALINKQLEEK